MFQRALLAAGLFVVCSPLWSWAEDPEPGRARVVVPSPGEGEASSEPPEAPSEAPANPVVPVPAPSAAEESDSPRITPGVERNITISIGPEPGEEWTEMKDFSYSRWRPVSRTQWLPGHRDRFGMFTLAGDSASAWENWNGLATTSGYAVHFLNGPVRTDLPSKVFDFTWGLYWNGEITEGWCASLAGRVGLFTDFEDSVRDGWRFPAHAVVFHDWTGQVQGVAGVKYLDRENLPPLPVLGLILRPNDRVRVEALFPEPRVAWRVYGDDDSENWLSLSGEIGGGEWAIERSNTDRADVVTYNDYNAVVGFHNYWKTGTDRAFEVGYTFARDLEYRSGAGDFEPEDTFFLRWSCRY